MKKIHAEGMRFYAEDGREVLFNGINVVCKTKETGYTWPDLEPVFRRFREQGMNLLRYGILWDGVEPEPGVYDDGYLGRVKENIRLAEKYGLYVFLDMHQDLFSVKWIDGAPLWATLDDGLPHPEGCTMWYEAYLSSEAVIRAADSFWQNRPAADGVGLIDHYAAMWSHIAEFFADCGNLIGLEPMNEPFMGSAGRQAFGIASMEVNAKYPGFDLSDVTKVTPEQQAYFMERLSAQFVEFDRTVLMEFYRKMQQAIAKGIAAAAGGTGASAGSGAETAAAGSAESGGPGWPALVTGGNIYCSSNVTTGLERLDGPTAQIYEPHGYDSVVDSDRYDSYSKANVEALFADKRASQERLGLPVIVGEWGAFPSGEFTNDLIEFMNGILEKYLWSSTYYDWQPGREYDPNFDALSRAYPVLTAGTLLSCRYDRGQKTFRMEYESSGEGETVIYCPFIPAKTEPGEGAGAAVVPVDEGSSACFIRVQAPKGKRAVALSAQA